jgi:predicted XRE-type DNA-binding protein
MKATNQGVSVQESSGNVFADLGLRGPKERLVKAQLAHRICQAIAARGFTQTQAARMMGLDQPKVSALRRGQLKGFSVERLFRCLNDLGQEVEIIIRPVQQAGRRGDVHVVAAAL